MSQENLELWRASIEAEFSFRADRSEFDPEATISKMACASTGRPKEPSGLHRTA